MKKTWNVLSAFVLLVAFSTITYGSEKARQFRNFSPERLNFVAPSDDEAEILRARAYVALADLLYQSAQDVSDSLVADLAARGVVPPGNASQYASFSFTASEQALIAKFHPIGPTSFQMLGSMRFHEGGATRFHTSGAT